MAHIKSSSFQDGDGIFLWQTEDDKRVRRIGGPYFSNEAADKASKAVSEAMGERPVEDYIKYLRQDYPGVVGGQSPIPKWHREPTDAEFEAIFKERTREYRKGLLDETPDEGMFRKNEEFYKEHPTDTLELSPTALDWFISPAEGAGYIPRSTMQELSYKGSTYDPALGSASPINYEALGIIPQEPASLFNVTDVELQRSIPINQNYQYYPADIEGVKWGNVLPERQLIEDLIWQAAEFAGLKPMYTEGFRTPAQNKLVGGDENSKHLIGQAFDVSIRGDTVANRAYFKKLEELLHPLGFGLEYFPSKNHIHIQYPRKGR